MPNRVLIVYAHPAHDRSRANRALRAARFQSPRQGALRDFKAALAPIQEMAHYFGMRCLPRFVTHGACEAAERDLDAQAPC